MKDEEIIRLELEKIKSVQITILIEEKKLYCLIPEYEEFLLITLREKYTNETYKDYEVYALVEFLNKIKEKGIINLPIVVFLVGSKNIKVYNSLARYAKKDYQTLLKREWFDNNKLKELNNYLSSYRIVFGDNNYMSKEKIKKLVDTYKRKNVYTHKEYKWYICIEKINYDKTVTIKVFDSEKKEYILENTISGTIKRAKMVNLINLYKYLSDNNKEPKNVLISTTSNTLFKTLDSLRTNEKTNGINNLYKKMQEDKENKVFTEGQRMVLTLLEQQRIKKYTIRLGGFPNFLKKFE